MDTGRQRSWTRVTGLVATAVLAGVLVGCGGGDEGPGETLPAESLARRSTLEVEIDR